jgi:hypothetical protein
MELHLGIEQVLQVLLLIMVLLVETEYYRGVLTGQAVAALVEYGVVLAEGDSLATVVLHYNLVE